MLGGKFYIFMLATTTFEFPVTQSIYHDQDFYLLSVLYYEFDSNIVCLSLISIVN